MVLRGETRKDIDILSSAERLWRRERAGVECYCEGKPLIGRRLPRPTALKKKEKRAEAKFLDETWGA